MKISQDRSSVQIQSSSLDANTMVAADMNWWEDQTIAVWGGAVSLGAASVALSMAAVALL